MRRMRAAIVLASAWSLVAAVACGKAYDSAPDPEPDASSSSSSGTGSSGSSGALLPPVVLDGAVDSEGPGQNADAGAKAAYYASCLSELAGGDPARAFVFWATVDLGGAKVSIELEALKADSENAVAKVTRTDITGVKSQPFLGTAAPGGRFDASIGAATVFVIPGAANPISGNDVEIEGPGLAGVVIERRFCARLTGEVKKPAAAQRKLDPDKNICIFVPIKEGDDRPTFAVAEYSAGACPK